MNQIDSALSLVYKVLRSAEWAAFEASGQCAGSPDDIRDGFVHLSTASQLPGTLAKHFVGQSDLVVLEMDAADLAPGLRWEASRSGALFPHLYGVLRLADVRISRRHVTASSS